MIRVLTPHSITRVRVARPMKVRALSPMSQTLIDQSYLIGKSITLFVGFYCGLQWLYYRDLIKRAEDTKKDEQKKKPRE